MIWEGFRARRSQRWQQPRDGHSRQMDLELKGLRRERPSRACGTSKGSGDHSPVTEGQRCWNWERDLPPPFPLTLSPSSGMFCHLVRFHHCTREVHSRVRGGSRHQGTSRQRHQSRLREGRREDSESQRGDGGVSLGPFSSPWLLAPCDLGEQEAELRDNFPPALNMDQLSAGLRVRWWPGGSAEGGLDWGSVLANAHQ